MVSFNRDAPLGPNGRYKEAKRWAEKFLHMRDLPLDELYLSCNNAAKRLGCTLSTIITQIERGDLKAVKVAYPKASAGFKYMIAESDYKAFAANYKKWAH